MKRARPFLSPFLPRRLPLALALSFFLALGACFGSDAKEEHFYFLQGPSIPLEKGKGPRLLVSDFSAGAGYESQRIAYRVSENELRYYAYHKWIAEPPQIVEQLVTRMLRATGGYAEVGRGSRLREPDAQLSGHVVAMEEVDKDEKTWGARLAMRFVLRRISDERVLLRHAFDHTVPCKERHPGQVARGIGRILAREVAKLNVRMLKALR